MRRLRALVFPLSVVLAISLADVTYAQFRKGLGRGTLEATLKRRRPPKVVITGTAIKVEVVAQTNGHDNVAQRFATALETQLLANDSRLRTGAASPETIVFCTITRLDLKQTPGQRQVQVNRRVGTKRVYNEKKKAYDEEPNYQLVHETQRYTDVRGDLAVSVQVRDRKTGATLDSQTFSPSYAVEFPADTTPPDKTQVEQSLIDQSVRLAVQRLTPTYEPVEVLLARPNDQVDELNRLGQAGLWARMLEQLELMKPIGDPRKEAYRLYNVGVANEALAYATDDLATSRKLLEQASSFYGKALELKPDEKYFREPQVRIADGIAAYAELDRQRGIIAQAESNSNANQSGPSGARDLVSSEKSAFTNRDVIDLVASGLDESNLLGAIKEAGAVNFDLSPGGLKQLLGAKVSNKVIAAMRAKQDGPKPKAAPSTPKTVISKPRPPGVTD